MGLDVDRNPGTQEPRRPGEVRTDEVQCFIQGTRLEGRAVRLSTREAILDLPAAQNLPPGTLIGMTFPSRRRGPFGVFLYGRSRTGFQGEGPIQVSWEKAVTAGSPEDLRWFLSEILDIRDAEVQEEPWGPRQETRRVFLFSGAGDPRFAPQGAQEVPARDAVQAPPDPEDPLEGLELEVIALRTDGTPLDRGQATSSQSPDPGTQEDRLLELPAPLAGRLEAEGFGLEVQVAALARSALRVRTAFVPILREDALEATFRIPTRRGEETVRCECRLEEVADRTLLLSIRKMIQESSTGVLDRYLRYLEIHLRGGSNGPGSGATPRDRDPG